MLWRWLDNIAHFLYVPTTLGRRHGRARWHHNIHLIPGRWLERACDRYDRWLGAYDNDGTVTFTSGNACATWLQHDTHEASTSTAGNTTVEWRWT